MRRTILNRFVEYVPKGTVIAQATSSAGLNNNIHLGTAAFRATEAAALRHDQETLQKGFFFLPKLSFSYEQGQGVSPVFSEKQFRWIYEVAHKDVVDALNHVTLGSDVEGHSLETVMRATSFDASRASTHSPACEHFNYSFFYNSLRPWGTEVPVLLRDALWLQYAAKAKERNLSVQALIERQFLEAAAANTFRSGWVYLVLSGDQFQVLSFDLGTSPIVSDLTPLLCMPVHENCFALDYDVEKDLEKYVANFFKGCNWHTAGRYYAATVGKSLDVKL